MRRTFLFATLVIISCSNVQNAGKIAKEDLIGALLKGFVASTKKHFPTVLEKLVTNRSLKNHSDKFVNTDLNPVMIVKALNNLKYILPDRIPLIPFAVAQPIPEYNILMYFAELSSSFVNLNQINAEATVDNTESNVSIAIKLHINSSSLEGHYELDISNYDMHLFGDGNYSISSNGTDIGISTAIQVFEDNSFLMSFFNTNISTSSCKLIMNNLLNGDPSVQSLIDFISETMSGDVSTVSAMMHEAINNSVVLFTNSYLANMFPWDEIVWLIQNTAKLNDN